MASLQMFRDKGLGHRLQSNMLESQHCYAYCSQQIFFVRIKQYLMTIPVAAQV